MSEVLSLQEAYDQTPDEEKASRWSVAACHKSHRSYVVCIAK